MKEIILTTKCSLLNDALKTFHFYFKYVYTQDTVMIVSTFSITFDVKTVHLLDLPHSF